MDDEKDAAGDLFGALVRRKLSLECPTYHSSDLFPLSIPSMLDGDVPPEIFPSFTRDIGHRSDTPSHQSDMQSRMRCKAPYDRKVAADGFVDETFSFSFPQDRLYDSNWLDRESTDHEDSTVYSEKSDMAMLEPRRVPSFSSSQRQYQLYPPQQQHAHYFSTTSPTEFTAQLVHHYSNRLGLSSHLYHCTERKLLASMALALQGIPSAIFSLEKLPPPVIITQGRSASATRSAVKLIRAMFLIRSVLNIAANAMALHEQQHQVCSTSRTSSSSDGGRTESSEGKQSTAEKVEWYSKSGGGAQEVASEDILGSRATSNSRQRQNDAAQIALGVAIAELLRMIDVSLTSWDCFQSDRSSSAQSLPRYGGQRNLSHLCNNKTVSLTDRTLTSESPVSITTFLQSTSSQRAVLRQIFALIAPRELQYLLAAEEKACSLTSTIHRRLVKANKLSIGNNNGKTARENEIFSHYLLHATWVGDMRANSRAGLSSTAGTGWCRVADTGVVPRGYELLETLFSAYTSLQRSQIAADETMLLPLPFSLHDTSGIEYADFDLQLSTYFTHEYDQRSVNLPRSLVQTITTGFLLKSVAGPLISKLGEIIFNLEMDSVHRSDTDAESRHQKPIPEVDKAAGHDMPNWVGAAKTRPTAVGNGVDGVNQGVESVLLSGFSAVERSVDVVQIEQGLKISLDKIWADCDNLDSFRGSTTTSAAEMSGFLGDNGGACTLIETLLASQLWARGRISMLLLDYGEHQYPLTAGRTAAAVAGGKLTSFSRRPGYTNKHGANPEELVIEAFRSVGAAPPLMLPTCEREERDLGTRIIETMEITRMLQSIIQDYLSTWAVRLGFREEDHRGGDMRGTGRRDKVKNSKMNSTQVVNTTNLSVQAAVSAQPSEKEGRAAGDATAPPSISSDSQIKTVNQASRAPLQTAHFSLSTPLNTARVIDPAKFNMAQESLLAKYAQLMRSVELKKQWNQWRYRKNVMNMVKKREELADLYATQVVDLMEERANKNLDSRGKISRFGVVHPRMKDSKEGFNKMSGNAFVRVRQQPGGNSSLSLAHESVAPSSAGQIPHVMSGFQVDGAEAGRFSDKRGEERRVLPSKMRLQQQSGADEHSVVDLRNFREEEIQNTNEIYPFQGVKMVEQQTERPSVRVVQQPGGNSTVDLRQDKTMDEASSLAAAKAEKAEKTRKMDELMEATAAAVHVRQSPGGHSTLDLRQERGQKERQKHDSVELSREIQVVSGGRDSGGLMSAERASVKVTLQPEGGISSIGSSSSISGSSELSLSHHAHTPSSALEGNLITVSDKTKQGDGAEASIEGSSSSSSSETQRGKGENQRIGEKKEEEKVEEEEEEVFVLLDKSEVEEESPEILESAIVPMITSEVSDYNDAAAVAHAQSDVITQTGADEPMAEGADVFIPVEGSPEKGSSVDLAAIKSSEEIALEIASQGEQALSKKRANFERKCVEYACFVRDLVEPDLSDLQAEVEVEAVFSSFAGALLACGAKHRLIDECPVEDEQAVSGMMAPATAETDAEDGAEIADRLEQREMRRQLEPYSVRLVRSLGRAVYLQCCALNLAALHSVLTGAKLLDHLAAVEDAFLVSSRSDFLMVLCNLTLDHQINALQQAKQQKRLRRQQQQKSSEEGGFLSRKWPIPGDFTRPDGRPVSSKRPPSARFIGLYNADLMPKSEINSRLEMEKERKAGGEAKSSKAYTFLDEDGRFYRVWNPILFPQSLARAREASIIGTGKPITASVALSASINPIPDVKEKKNSRLSQRGKSGGVGLNYADFAIDPAKSKEYSVIYSELVEYLGVSYREYGEEAAEDRSALQPISTQHLFIRFESNQRPVRTQQYMEHLQRKIAPQTARMSEKSSSHISTTAAATTTTTTTTALKSVRFPGGISAGGSSSAAGVDSDVHSGTGKAGGAQGGAPQQQDAGLREENADDSSRSGGGGGDGGMSEPTVESTLGRLLTRAGVPLSSLLLFASVEEHAPHLPPPPSIPYFPSVAIPVNNKNNINTNNNNNHNKSNISDKYCSSNNGNNTQTTGAVGNAAAAVAATTETRTGIGEKGVACLHIDIFREEEEMLYTSNGIALLALSVAYRAPWPLPMLFSQDAVSAHLAHATRRYLELGHVSNLIRLVWSELRQRRRQQAVVMRHRLRHLKEEQLLQERTGAGPPVRREQQQQQEQQRRLDKNPLNLGDKSSTSTGSDQTAGSSENGWAFSDKVARVQGTQGSDTISPREVLRAHDERRAQYSELLQVLLLDYRVDRYLCDGLRLVQRVTQALFDALSHSIAQIRTRFHEQMMRASSEGFDWVVKVFLEYCVNVGRASFAFTAEEVGNLREECCRERYEREAEVQTWLQQRERERLEKRRARLRATSFGRKIRGGMSKTAASYIEIGLDNDESSGVEKQEGANVEDSLEDDSGSSGEESDGTGGTGKGENANRSENPFQTGIVQDLQQPRRAHEGRDLLLTLKSKLFVLLQRCRDALLVFHYISSLWPSTHSGTGAAASSLGGVGVFGSGKHPGNMLKDKESQFLPSTQRPSITANKSNAGISGAISRSATSPISGHPATSSSSLYSPGGATEAAAAVEQGLDAALRLIRQSTVDLHSARSEVSRAAQILEAATASSGSSGSSNSTQISEEERKFAATLNLMLSF